MWQKRGQIYSVPGSRAWSRSHAQLPTVSVLDPDIWRIYFATRDANSRSLTTYVEVEAGNPARICYEHPEPILDLGARGAFDDSGIMPACAVRDGENTHLYYTGWTTRGTVPYQNAIGLALSRNREQTFERVSDGPVLGLSAEDPLTTGSPFVSKEAGLWRMWYHSCTKWENVDGTLEPFYHVRYAESSDGIHWNRDRPVAIDFSSPDEAGIGRPTVVGREGLYRMWYCFRNARGYRTNLSSSYRIGYAESSDGKHWTRKDDIAGIDVSPDGWDCEMIAYPQVVAHRKQWFLFYNGNGFGRTGFGYAVAERPQD